MNDLRYALRQLRRTPGFTAVAVLTLSLGIGAATTVFAIVNAMALRPLATSHVDDVFEVVTRAPLGVETSVAAFRAIDARPPASVVAITANDTAGWPLVQAPGHAEILSAAFITSGFQRVFDVGVEAGHWLTPDEDRDASTTRLAIISERVWREWFDRRPDVVGRASLRLNRLAFTIVGVAPQGFRGSTDVWLPLGNCVFLLSGTTSACSRVADVYVRSPHGFSKAQLTAEISAIESQFPSDSVPEGPRPMPISLTHATGIALRPAWNTTPLVMPAAMMLLGLAALILVAACANLANMLYARGVRRAAEIAVRRSLGASRARIVRLLVVEAAVIAAGAAAAGLVCVLGLLAIFAHAFPALRLSPLRMPLDVQPDYRVWIAAFGAGAAAALIVGLAIAWRSSRVEALRTLAASGAPGGSAGRGGRLRTALVAVQITSAVVLIIFSGLYLENAPAALDERVHFDTAHVVSGGLDLGRHGYERVKDSKTYYGARGDAFFDRLLTAVERLPGVEAAAYAESMPAGVGPASPSLTTLTAEGTRGVANDALHRITASYSSVSPGFLRVINLPLRAGRDLAPWDRDGAMPVAVVSESIAAVLWPGQVAVGKRLMFGHNLWLTVVGVSADPLSARSDSVLTRGSNLIFVPLAQVAQQPARYILVRSTTPAAVIDPLRAAARAVDDDVAVLDAATMDESIFAWYGPQRAARVLMTSLGGCALVIAMLGVYGVIAYFVSIRTREFGIRLALGATPGRLARLVVDHAVHLVLVGLLAGVFVASVGSRLIEANRAGTLIYPNIGTMISPTMPNGVLTWTISPLLILAAGLLAAYLPARRASRLNPSESLRY